MSLFLAANHQTLSELPPWGIAVIVAALAIILPLYWWLLMQMVSRVGHWHRLAKVYDAGDRQPSGTLYRRVFGAVGMTRYNFALTVHVNAEGFFLEVPRYLRIAHPPLFIPWSAVSARGRRRVIWWDCTTLTIGQPILGVIALRMAPELLQPPAP